MAQFSPMLAIANNIKGIDFTITMSFNQFMDNNVFGRKGIADIKQIKSLAIGRYGLVGLHGSFPAAEGGLEAGN